MKTLRAVCLFVSVFFLLVSSALCQTFSTGTPAYGSFLQTPAGTLNLGNLNLHLGIPVIQKAGRGTPFSYSILYDSSAWYPVMVNGVSSWQPVTNFGWSADALPNLGYLSYNTIQHYCYEIIGNRNVRVTYYTKAGFAYTDKFGRRHGFDNVYGEEPCDGIDLTSDPGYARDGSGYTLSGSMGGPWTVTDPSGASFTPPTVRGTGTSGNYTDANGNQITLNNGVFTDTLGTIALTITGSGTPSSPINLQYTAPGGPTSYQLTYVTKNIKTNFGCSGINEYTASNVLLVNSVTLPDKTAYTFTYESTPGNSGYVTGRVASIQLPAGGTVTFDYSGGSTVCTDGTPGWMKITTPDGGTTTISRSIGSGTASTSTVTDPQNNQTIIKFQTASYQGTNYVYEANRTITDNNGKLLETVDTCYNGATPDCTSTAITLPISEIKTYTALPDSSGVQSLVDQSFNVYGLLTYQWNYDFGAGAYGALLRKEVISYAASPVGAPISDAIYDGAGTLVAQTKYTYDEGTVQPTNNTPSHVSASGARGNPTTVSRLVSGSTLLSSKYTYFDTGLVYQFTDINSSSPTYTYAYGACGNSFPTQVAGPDGTSKATWDCNGGVQLTSIDMNQNSSSTTYSDPYFWRPASTSDAAGNVTSFTYTSTLPLTIESVLSVNASSSVDKLTTLDTVGSVLTEQTRQTPTSSNFDTISYGYDLNGRQSFVSLPYVSTQSASGTTTKFDALSRPQEIDDSGNGYTKVTYVKNSALVSVGPAPSGEYLKSKQYKFDGLGRMTAVCEVTSTLSGYSNCNLPQAANGYLTTYAYNALGQITQVNQAGTQTRTFSYDGLGRLLSEANPETAGLSTTYVYDTDSTCGTSNGDLVKKVDPQGNTICFSYDSMHRITAITYPSGSYAAVTPQKHFVYGAATVNVNGTNTSMSNPVGRLAEAYTGTSANKTTDLFFSYSATGQVTDTWQQSPNSGGYYHVSGSYWPNGSPLTLGIMAGTSSVVPTITYGVDGEGRPSSASTSSGSPQLNTSTTFSLTQPQVHVTYGTQHSDDFTLDTATGRQTKFANTLNGNSITGTLTWNQNGSLGGLTIVDQVNPPASSTSQTCSYSHDDLFRISAVNCGSAWQQTFTIDAFGNLKKNPGGSLVFAAGYDQTTNRINSGFSNLSYDNNGALKGIDSASYSWDADGNSCSLTYGSTTVNMTYDALDRAVEQTSGSGYTQVLYGLSGAKLALMNGQTLTKAFIPIPGGATAVYNSSGLAYYRHPDWLGSSRLATTAGTTPAVYYSASYAPYGEVYNESGTRDRNFTGQNQDALTDHYDFLYRELQANHGRWLSPDPAGLAAVNPSNPQSWNRYAYVVNNPLALFDPLGLDPPVDKPCPPGTHWVGGPPDDKMCEPDPPPVIFNTPNSGNGCTDIYVDGVYIGSVCPTGTQSGKGGGGGGGNLTPEQEQCVRNEINYANRVRQDTLQGSNGRILSGLYSGAATGAKVGAAAGFVGGEFVGGIGGIPGALLGGFLGGVSGGGAGFLKTGFQEIWNNYRYDYSFLGRDSTYMQKLKENVKNKCGVTLR